MHFTLAEDLIPTDTELYRNFVKPTNGSNSVIIILITPEFIQGLKNIQFELKDREKCNSLPNVAALKGLDTSKDKLSFLKPMPLVYGSLTSSRKRFARVIYSAEGLMLATSCTVVWPKKTQIDCVAGYGSFNKRVEVRCE